MDEISKRIFYFKILQSFKVTVTKWLSGSALDSYVCMASYLGPGFEPIWGVTMRLASTPRNRSPNPLRALDSYTATKSLIYTCIK